MKMNVRNVSLRMNSSWTKARSFPTHSPNLLDCSYTLDTLDAMETADTLATLATLDILDTLDTLENHITEKNLIKDNA